MVELAKRRWAPDRDFEVRRDGAGGPGLRLGDLAVVRVTPAVETQAQEIEGL